jgi:transposase
VQPDDEQMAYGKQYNAGFVVGTNIEASQLSDADIMQAYKGQAQAEGGFRFLKEPLFFVSSLCVKQPSRMQGLLMVMTLALWVYAVAQRRLRQQLARQNETVPNQINQPTVRPTLRWVFQLLEGIHRVRVTVQGQVYDLRVAQCRFYQALFWFSIRLPPTAGRNRMFCLRAATPTRYAPCWRRDRPDQS